MHTVITRTLMRSPSLSLLRSLLLSRSLIAAVFFLASPLAPAQPATLTADNFELDLENGTRIYRGAVEYRHRDVQLTCDQLTAKQDGNEIAQGICTGKPARFMHTGDGDDASAGVPSGNRDGDGTLRGSAHKITFTAAAEKKRIILETKAEVQRGDYHVTGARITYNLLTKRIVVDDGDINSDSDGEFIKRPQLIIRQ